MRRALVALVVVGAALGGAALPRAEAAADGQVTFAVHVTLAPRWLDPAQTESAITPFMVLYAIHDALLKPMPGGPTTPSKSVPDETTRAAALKRGEVDVATS